MADTEPVAALYIQSLALARTVAPWVPRKKEEDCMLFLSVAIFRFDRK